MKEQSYAGMTVNERLFISGLMDRFDKAVREKNTADIRNILEELDVDDESINAITVQYRSNLSE